MIIDQFHENIVMFSRRNKRIETRSKKHIQLSIWISHSTKSNTAIFIWQLSWLSISLIIQSQYSIMRKLCYLEEVQRYDNSIQIIWIEEYFNDISKKFFLTMWHLFRRFSRCQSIKRLRIFFYYADVLKLMKIDLFRIFIFSWSYYSRLNWFNVFIKRRYNFYFSWRHLISNFYNAKDIKVSNL
jgi:hypothetical protein